MRTTLYIPKKIVVGFQERSDTFTKKLAYVIYYDEKNKLRKETSWNSWRDNKIPSITFDNVPTAGYTFNKGVQRDGYWGSGRSMIRVYDSRDFEFEVSIDNLMGLLMHSDLSKRELTQECVFAWYGTELILLPTNSVEYEQSVKHTTKINAKFSAKDLQLGHTYIRKRPEYPEELLVYLGRHDYHDIEHNYLSCLTPINGQLFSATKRRRHIFMDSKSRDIYHKLEPSTHISSCVDAAVHPDFSFFMDDFSKDAAAQDIVDLVIKPATSQNRDSFWYKSPAGLLVKISKADDPYRHFGYSTRSEEIKKRLATGEVITLPFLRSRGEVISENRALAINHNSDGSVRVELNRSVHDEYVKQYRDAADANYRNRYSYAYRQHGLDKFPEAGYKYTHADWIDQIPNYPVLDTPIRDTKKDWYGLEWTKIPNSTFRELFDQYNIGEVYAVFRDGSHSKKPLDSSFGF